MDGNQLQQQLSKQGLAFSSLTLTHQGQYAAQDADWNYKDIPHLDEVHQLVSSVQILARGDLTLNIFLQKVGPVTIPLSVVNLQHQPNGQLYYTSAFFFVLIIETTWDEKVPNLTKVTTHYRIGSPRILKFVHPIIRRMLARNYSILMAADIPMREQRGRLRSRGFSFQNDNTGYKFDETTNLSVSNLRYPVPRSWETRRIHLDELFKGTKGEIVLSADHIRLAIVHGRPVAFPLLCPHEGASLCDVPISERGLIRCPWHGRQLGPKNLDQGTEVEIHPNCFASLSGTVLTLRSSCS